MSAAGTWAGEAGLFKCGTCPEQKHIMEHEKKKGLFFSSWNALFRIDFKLYLLLNFVITLIINAVINGPITFYVLFPQEILQDTGLWKWPTPIAGDVFVSLFLGCSITWNVASQLTYFDISRGDSFPFVVSGLSWLDFARRQPSRWNYFTSLHRPLQLPGEFKHKRAWIMDSIKAILPGFAIGFLVAALCFPVFIGVGTLVLKDSWPDLTLLWFKMGYAIPIALVAIPSIITSAAEAVQNKDSSTVVPTNNV